MKKLYRSNINKMLCGVCGGMAEYFDLDPTLMRVLWIILGLAGPGVIAYIICAFLIPQSPEA